MGRVAMISCVKVFVPKLKTSKTFSENTIKSGIRWSLESLDYSKAYFVTADQNLLDKSRTMEKRYLSCFELKIACLEQIYAYFKNVHVK